MTQEKANPTFWARLREFKDTLTAVAAILALLVSLGLPSYSFWLGLFGWDGARVDVDYLNQFDTIGIGVDDRPLDEQGDRVRENAMFFFARFANDGFSSASVYGKPTCRAPGDADERNRLVFDTYNADRLQKELVYLAPRTETPIAFKLDCNRCYQLPQGQEDRLQPGYCRVEVGDKYGRESLFIEFGDDLNYALPGSN